MKHSQKLTIGLTGGIGAGKSVVAQLFQLLDIPVYNSDWEARQLMNTSREIIEGLKSLFGKDIYLEIGVLDRKKLASYIFNDKIALEKVNNLVHPIVGQHFFNWASAYECPYVIQETAILFENNLQERYDAVIAVIAPEEIRINRVCKRDEVPEKMVKERVKNQISDKFKCEHSDFCIVNDDRELVIPQVIEINKRLIEKWENLQNGLVED